MNDNIPGSRISNISEKRASMTKHIFHVFQKPYQIISDPYEIIKNHYFLYRFLYLMFPHPYFCMIFRNFRGSSVPPKFSCFPFIAHKRQSGVNKGITCLRRADTPRRVPKIKIWPLPNPFFLIFMWFSNNLIYKSLIKNYDFWSNLPNCK